jgi:DNA-binding IclR family transcriptional regulator
VGVVDLAEDLVCTDVVRQDVGGVAAVVLDSTRMPIGALSVTLPMHRLTAEIIERYGRLVVVEAARLSAMLDGRSAWAS